MLRSSCIFLLANLRGGERLNGDSIKKPTNLSQLIPMKKILLALAITAGLTSFAGNAKADFNYSFTPSYIQGSGFGTTVTGTIFGTFNNNGSAFNLTSISAKSGDYFTTINVTDANTAIGNTLSEIGGAISGKARIATLNINGNNRAGGPDISVDFTGFSMWGMTSFDSFYQPNFNDITVAYAGDSPATVVTGAVPEPSTYALFGIGAIGLMMVLRRKKIA
jgi:hypothetical protein